ncbi:amino acid permease-associated region [Vibrio ishigakensis]|uniref:Amino acid permease-associated region n=1 Tax=Vibrio ishigakensis TaxID=1481914 RepID=A0A0B8NVY1_9VIBR|nr:APC family permease [Vibrio ishigakensis]GAM55268.1 amino acid permease-associated region [Vibrio ishigakensis]
MELKKNMGFGGLLIYALIFMVPIAPFGIYGDVFNVSHGMVGMVYLTGFVGMVFTALSYGRMMKEFRKSGSVYEYAKRGLGANAGFIGGWCMLLDYIIIPALLYIVATIAMHEIVPEVPALVWAAIFIAFNTVAALVGLNFTEKVNKVFLGFMLLLIGVFVVTAYRGLVAGEFPNSQGFTMAPFFQKDHFSIGLVFSAVSIAVMSFLGFDGVSTLTEEAKDGVKTHYVPFVSLCIAVVLFLAQVVFAAWVLPNADAFQENSGNAWYVVARIVGGGYLSTACALLTALSWGITNALASQTAVSRVIFGMAKDGVLPKSLSALNGRFRTPHVAILLSGVVSAVLVFLFEDHLDVFVSFVNFGALTGFILLHLAVISWCNIKNKRQNLFVELISPLCGIAILSYVWISLDQSAKLLGLAWLVVGVVVIGINKSRGVSINMEAID